MRDDIIAQIEEIPAIPVSASEGIQLLQNSNKSLGEVVKLFEYDPGVTANILKLVNSAAFRGERDIASLQEAVVRLGASKVLQLLISSSMTSYMCKPVKGYDLPPGELWRSSVNTAVCTEEIASALKLDLPEYAFTAGLLHDIGKIILGSFLDVNAQEIVDYAVKNGLAFVDAERKMLGIDHAEAGSILLRKWNLPAEFENPVRWHHEPEKCKGNIVTEVVHIADALTMMGGIGVGTEGLNYRISEEVAESLGLNINIIEKIIFNTQMKSEELKDLFSA